MPRWRAGAPGHNATRTTPPRRSRPAPDATVQTCPARRDVALRGPDGRAAPVGSGLVQPRGGPADLASRRRQGGGVGLPTPRPARLGPGGVGPPPDLPSPCAVPTPEPAAPEVEVGGRAPVAGGAETASAGAGPGGGAPPRPGADVSGSRVDPPPPQMRTVGSGAPAETGGPPLRRAR